METCIRGFSFMPTNKIEVADLQYIEGGELERAWRSTRRERLKQREQRIWDEFVKENDVVRDVCSGDPYEFLDQLPEPCLKEIMEKELQKMVKQNAEEEAAKKEKMEKTDAIDRFLQEPRQQGSGDSPPPEDNQHVCVVTFADNVEKDDSDLFHIFDDDQSGAEDDVPNGAASPPTVRENPPPPPSLAPIVNLSDPVLSDNATPERPGSSNNDKASSKSSENVTNVIESSIYCAKVKELRLKISEEIQSMMISMDRRDILTIEAENIGRLIKRSGEFSSRFNRIYMYQLQRQMHEIKRNNDVTLPFAKHTQFQSQMVRIVSLHQNLLQSFQVFHKCVQHTCAVGEGGAALRALVSCARAAHALCAHTPTPKDFTAATDLYNDELITTCNKFEEFVEEYIKGCQDLIERYETMALQFAPKKTKETKAKGKKRPWPKNVASKPPIEADAKLSMYSLDNLRLNLNVKSSSSKENQASSVTSKIRTGRNVTTATTTKKPKQPEKTPEQPKSTRKSPKCRRPLMRDPQAGRPRPPRAHRTPRDTDVPTMVEAVDNVSLVCASSQLSQSGSPRSAHEAHNVSRTNTIRRFPRPPHLTPRSAVTLHPHITPRKPHLLPHTSRLENKRFSSMSVKSRPQRLPSPKSPNNLKQTLSSIKSDQETVVDSCPQMTPVCKIQCAMKKDLDMESGTSKQAESSHYQPAEHHEERQPPKKLVSPSSRNRTEVVDKKEWSKTVPDRCEVTRLLKQLCSGDGSGRTERVSGAKNAQLLHCVGSSSPRQPSTPQLLRILEETIQKKVPKQLFPKSPTAPERFHLAFNVSEKTCDAMFQYRTKFVQHMLTSPLYANSAVGKPWEMIGSISEQIIDELLLTCIKEMELRDVILKLYNGEMR